MPHIVFDGPVDLEELQKTFKPIIDTSSNILKIKEMYLNSRKNNAFFPTLTIDETTQEFFIELLTGDEKTTIRLLPLTDPKKTDLVKYALVHISKLVSNLDPSLKITKTNLQEYLGGRQVC